MDITTKLKKTTEENESKRLNFDIKVRSSDPEALKIQNGIEIDGVSALIKEVEKNKKYLVSWGKYAHNI